MYHDEIDSPCLLREPLNGFRPCVIPSVISTVHPRVIRLALMMYIRFKRGMHFLRRAVDREGEVSEVFATRRRGRKAALSFPMRAMIRYGQPKAVVTNRLRPCLDTQTLHSRPPPGCVPHLQTNPVGLAGRVARAVGLSFFGTETL